MVIGENICVSLSFLIICYYLAKKGLKFDKENNKAIKAFLRKYLLFSLVIFFCLSIY